MLPFNLTVFFTAMLVVRLYKTAHAAPNRPGIGFALCTVALLWLAFVVRNDWSAVPVMFGLIAVRHRPGRPGDAASSTCWSRRRPRNSPATSGSLRGTTQNLAAGVGTAVAGAVLVGVAQQHDPIPNRRESEPAGRGAERRSTSTTSPS